MLTEKQQALTRRANMLIERLKRPDYARFVNHDTTIQLARLAWLINWALERSIPFAQYDKFRNAILGARYLLLDKFNNEIQEGSTYFEALEIIVQALKEYREYVNQHDISVVYED